MRAEVGDFTHWTKVWGHSIDAWGVIVETDGVNFEMRILKGCSIKHNGCTWVWMVGRTVNLDTQVSKHVTCSIVSIDDVPDEIVVEMAKLALVGGE